MQQIVLQMVGRGLQLGAFDGLQCTCFPDKIYTMEINLVD